MFKLFLKTFLNCLLSENMQDIILYTLNEIVDMNKFNTHKWNDHNRREDREVRAKKGLSASLLIYTYTFFAFTPPDDGDYVRKYEYSFSGSSVPLSALQGGEHM